MDLERAELKQLYGDDAERARVFKPARHSSPTSQADAPLLYQTGPAIHLRAAPKLQAKLSISQPGDEYEREADRAAEQVMRVPDTAIGSQHKDVSERASDGAGDVSAQLAAEPSAAQQETGAASTSIVTEVLSSPGQPLDASTQRFMEARFGRDLSKVRVHTDSRAAESAESLNAQAYTVGRDIVFGLGQYAPGGASGKRLIAHEVSHVIQQGHSLPAPQPGPSQIISHAPANQQMTLIQRQPKPASTTHLPDIRRVFESKAPPELLALIKKIDLKKTTPQEVMKTVINGTKHVWELTLTFHTRPAGGSSTNRGKQTTDTKRGEVHPIISEVAFQHSTIDVPSTAPAMQIKDSRERGIYMTAQDLLHELTHVLLIIGIDIAEESAKAGTTPAPGQLSKVYQEYKSVFDVVNGPAFKEPRDRVIEALTDLFQRSSDILKLDFPKERLAAKATNDIEKLVNEKFTFGKAGERFGFTPTNNKIATSYVPTYVKELFDPALGSTMHSLLIGRLENNSGWVTFKDGAVRAVTNLYNEIDKDLSLKGYLLPGTITTTSPALPMPLQISGVPAPSPGTVTDEKIDISKLFPE